MHDIDIRTARADDLDALITLWTELADGRALALPASGESARLKLERICNDSSRNLLVAETVADGVVGSLDVIIVENMTYQLRSWAIVENVIVTSGYRRRGVGTALFEKAIVIANDAGCYKVQLHSGKQRNWAHALYRSVGFEAVAEGFKLYLDGR